jgi:N-acetylglutamate synthase-like GNAT family acetyltransferase
MFTRLAARFNMTWLAAYNPDAIELPLHQNVFVAEMVGSIQGFAAILPRPDENSELDALFVEPELWRQGVGRRLVEYCCFAAKSAGSTELHVVGNLEAKRFYEASGFMSLGTKQMRFGVSLLMKRALP